MSKIKLSLRVAIVLLTLCAVFLAWLAWNRNRNSDRLQAVLEKVGPENVDVTNSGIEPDDGWWENLLADTSPRPGELRFFSVSNELADLLAASQATDQITSLTLVHYSKNNAFFNGRTVIGDSGEFDPPLSNKSNSGDQPFVADDCNMFFKAWQNLERLVIRDVALPSSWLSEFKSMPALKELVVSGGLCNFDPACLNEIATLEHVVFCQRGVTQLQLEQLRDQMPDVRFEVFGCFETRYEYSEAAQAETLSVHDPEAYERMKELLDSVNKAIVTAGGGNTHPATTATTDEIARLERELGVPLPKSLRAFYEVTNGWQKAPIFIWNGIRTTQDVADDYHSRMDLVYKPDEYDFTGFKFDQFANPNAIPINDAEGIHFNEDRLCRLDPDGESGPSAYDTAHDLYLVFEKVLKELERKKFETYKKQVTVWVDFQK